MDYIRVNHRLTGNYYFKKRFFGGFTLMVEEQYNVECQYTLDLSPRFSHFRKGNLADLIFLGLKFQ